MSIPRTKKEFRQRAIGSVESAETLDQYLYALTYAVLSIQAPDEKKLEQEEARVELEHELSNYSKTPETIKRRAKVLVNQFKNNIWDAQNLAHLMQATGFPLDGPHAQDLLMEFKREGLLESENNVLFGHTGG
ncbi:hypothetical protein [Streptomyces sp. CoH17]|uniref:hypothetical protein n=1 Tax=Streptomyces sp. CoH17 TaxID=2992806 RepID=UPI002270DF24|nr:hypothetical protein [Streptomyces sp. CoH17]